MIKKLLQDVLAPICLFTMGLFLLGCDQAHQSNSKTSEHSTSNTREITTTSPVELKSGNMLYIIQDIADFQLKAGKYIEQLQQTKQHIKDAIQLKDQMKLQTYSHELKTQLNDFNKILKNLDSKSNEIYNIRQNIINTNQQILDSAFLNGKLDFSEAHFQHIEQQMGNVQSEMIKLAQMFVQNGQKSDHS